MEYEICKEEYHITMMMIRKPFSITPPPLFFLTQGKGEYYYVHSFLEHTSCYSARSSYLVHTVSHKEQKALQLPFHLRNSTVLSLRLAHIFCVNSRRSWQPASQSYFVDIPLIRSNIKGGSKHFSSQNHRARATKLFSRFFSSARLQRFVT